MLKYESLGFQVTIWDADGNQSIQVNVPSERVGKMYAQDALTECGFHHASVRQYRDGKRPLLLLVIDKVGKYAHASRWNAAETEETMSVH